MRIGKQGENLIFLIAQPRSGSTLLQRILGSHPGIHTRSEPWIMLHPLYALRTDGHVADYDTGLAGSALREFLQGFDGTEEDFLEGVRRMYGYLYDRALQASKKRFFLDKTPRYYHIVSELHRTFPHAKYVFLLRNPVAVLCSILHTWAQASMLALHEYRFDLLSAPGLILKGISELGDQAIVVRYEDLVTDSAREVKRICRFLMTEFYPDMLEYASREQKNWRFGDQESIRRHRRPEADSRDRWISEVEDPQVWRLAGDYVEMLGKELLDKLGYPFDDLRRQLRACRRSSSPLRRTLPLRWFFRRPAAERSIGERLLSRLAAGGIPAVISATLRRMRHRDCARTGILADD